MSGKNIALSGLLGLAFVAGVLEHWFASQVASTLSMAHLAISIVLIFSWFYLDSRESNYQSTVALKLFIVGLTVFALPYYFFRSRGGRRGFKALGLAVLVFIAAMILYRFGTWVLPSQ